MKRQKYILKQNQQHNSSKKYIPIYNLAEEEVQKLNIDSNILSPINFDDDKEMKLDIKNKLKNKMPSKIFKYFESKEKLQNSQINISTNSTNGYNEITEEDLALTNNLSTSIQKLKTLIPDINKKMANNYSAIINIPKKDYKVESNENYLNSVLTHLYQKVKKIKNKKFLVENELNNIEKEINDKQLFIELAKDDNFQKNIKLKIIQKFEQEYNESKNKELNDITNSQTNSIDKKELFSLKNKYKDEKEIKEQKISESKKAIEEKNIIDELKERAFKSKLNNMILTNQILTKQKSDRFTKEIIELKERKKITWEKIDIYNEKLKKLHSIQHKIKDSLYMYYLSILKEGKDTRDEGLAWVIAEILNLGKKVLISHVPKYLDEKSILYLFIKAHIILKIKYIEKKINELNDNEKDKANKEIKKITLRDNLKLKARKTLNNIKEKFIFNKYENNIKKMPLIENEKNSSNLNPISLNKYKISSLFLKKSDKKLSKSNSMIIYKHRNNYLQDEKGNDISNNIKINENKKLLLKQNKKISFEKYIAWKDEIEKLKELKETLKEKEMERIFEEFRLKKYSKKYNIDKKIVLSALIGEQNITKEFTIQNKKEKLLKEERGKTRLYVNDYLINKSVLMNGGSILLDKI